MLVSIANQLETNTKTENIKFIHRPDICKDKWERLMAANNWNAIELRDNRYNQIIHMVSAANGAEDFYSVEVNGLHE